MFPITLKKGKYTGGQHLFNFFSSSKSAQIKRFFHSSDKWVGSGWAAWFFSQLDQTIRGSLYFLHYTNLISWPNKNKVMFPITPKKKQVSTQVGNISVPTFFFKLAKKKKKIFFFIFFRWGGGGGGVHLVQS